MTSVSYDDNEGLLIAALLISGRAGWDRVRSRIDPTDFLDEFYGELFESIESLISRNQPVSIITVVGEYKRKFDREWTTGASVALANNIRDAGGVPVSTAVKNIRDSIPTALHLNYYCDQILVAAEKREMSTAAAVSAQGGDVDFDGLLAKWATRKSEQREDEKSCNDANIGNTVVAYLESLKEGENSLTIPGVLPEFDSVIGGELETGQMVVVAAHQGTGKTLFTLQSMLRASDQGVKCCFFSQEMDAVALGRRLYDMIHEVDPPANNKSIDDLIDYTRSIFARRHCVYRKVEANPVAICNEMRRQSERGVQLFAIDHLQFIRGQGRSDYERVSEACRQIKLTTTELGCTTYLISQVNREGRGGCPSLRQLRGSGRIEEDADVVLILYRPWMDNKEFQAKDLINVDPRDAIEIHFAKMRNRALPNNSLCVQMTVKPFRLARCETVAESEGHRGWDPF